MAGLQTRHTVSGNCFLLVCFVTLPIVYTLKNSGLFQPKFGSNMDKMK